MATCHPTPITQPHRKEGTENTHTCTPVWERLGAAATPNLQVWEDGGGTPEQSMVPTPHRDLALLLTSPRLHSWRGENKWTVSAGQEDASWDSPASPAGTVSPRSHKEDTGGCRVLWSSPSQLPHLNTEHSFLQPPLPPPQCCCPQSITGPSLGRQSRALAGTQLPHVSLAAEPEAAGGSERHQDHQCGPRAHFGQSTAQLGTASCMGPGRAGTWSRASRGGRMDGAPVDMEVLQTPVPQAAATVEQRGSRRQGWAGDPPANWPRCRAKPWPSAIWNTTRTCSLPSGVVSSCTSSGAVGQRVPESWGAAPGRWQSQVQKQALHPYGSDASWAARCILCSIQVCSSLGAPAQKKSVRWSCSPAVEARLLPPRGSHASSAALREVAKQAEQ